jgi:hypothetical protein
VGGVGRVVVGGVVHACHTLHAVHCSSPSREENWRVLRPTAAAGFVAASGGWGRACAADPRRCCAARRVLGLMFEELLAAGRLGVATSKWRSGVSNLWRVGAAVGP